MLADKTLDYYASLESGKVLEEVGSSLDGLSSSEARKRLREFGRNTISEKREHSVVLEYLSHFKSPLVIILLFACAVSAFFRETLQAIIISIMILLSVTLDFFLEHNAEDAAKRLKETVKSMATAVRDGEKRELAAEELCPGDLILLSAGSLVPADSRLLSAKYFFVNQSSLTGESFPVEKTSARLDSGKQSTPGMSNMVFMGTNVVSGSATAVVLKTGMATEFGKVAANLVSADTATEFDRGVASFGYLIMKVTIFLVLFIFLFNSLLRGNILQSLLFALAVAVGLTPELLPMIMSITMAQGSIRMAKKGAIVKRLSSIPNFGSMDVLCTDKTGTLTQDKIKLVKYTDVLGRDSPTVLRYAYLNGVFQSGIKNPLDDAILGFRKIDISGYRKFDEIPFDFARKKISVIVEQSGKRYLITKGAPEEVFKSCGHYCIGGRPLLLGGKALEQVARQYHNFSRQGYRVLAVAVKELKRKKRVYDKGDESDMELHGFVSFLDPPKEDAKEVVRSLHDIGIEVKVVTGDNELVTKRICDEIGLKVKGILLGGDVEELSDDALRVKAERTTIFARFSPSQKDRVILALKAEGHVVGYLGDGINDAPSLRTADIGLSVNSAVDVAKESADIVLTRKSLRLLGEGVLEGRKTFANTMKYIMMGLSSNFGNMFSVAVAILFLPFLPMLPVQILLTNFLYDLSQVVIPTDNVDQEYVQKPRRWNMGFIRRFMLVFGPVSSVFDLLTFFMLLSVFKLSAPFFQTGWFIESLTTQTFVIHIIRTKKIPFLQSRPSGYLLLGTIVCIALGWILPYTGIGSFFGFARLPLNIVLAIAWIVIVYLVTVEVVKRLFYRKYDF